MLENIAKIYNRFENYSDVYLTKIQLIWFPCLRVPGSWSKRNPGFKTMALNATGNNML